MNAQSIREFTPGGGLMIDSISIRNFRCYRDIKIGNCRRINLLVGDNGSGKTALLEALFLVAGVQPAVTIQTRVWRGMDTSQVSGTQDDIYEALWGDLFFKFQASQGAVISLKGSEQQTRSVAVNLFRQGRKRVVPPPRNKSGIPVRLVPDPSPMEFKWQIRGLADITLSPSFVNGQLVFPPVSNVAVKASFYAANQTAPGWEAARNFSRLSTHFDERKFVDTVCSIFPRIKGLSIDLSAGMPLLFAQIENIPQKLPLSLASGGLNKLAGILLSIAEQSGGIVIIDEIENGFFYKRMPSIWDAIFKFAKEYNCQIFASTHSVECLETVAKLAVNSPDEFCLFRTVFSDTGSLVRQFDGARFADAVLDDVDVR